MEKSVYEVTPSGNLVEAEKLPCWPRFKAYMWNPSKKEFMGRGGESWAKQLSFYFILYINILGLFCAMFAAFHYSVIDDRRPHLYTGAGAVMLQTPGLAFKPHVCSSSSCRKLLVPRIEFTASNPASYSSHKNILSNFLSSYSNVDTQEVNASCDATNSGMSASCNLSRSLLGPCDGISDPDFGYSSGNPCVLIKVNKLYNWKPVAYSSYPNNTNNVLPFSRWDAQSVGISCEGERDSDIANLGAVQFYPQHGFPFDCFPFCSGDGGAYRAPLVMARFSSLTAATDVRVWCRIWARNVDNGHGSTDMLSRYRRDQNGGVRFIMRKDN